VQLEGLGESKKSDDLICNRTQDLLACSIVPQPTMLLCGPMLLLLLINFQLNQNDILCLVHTQIYFYLYEEQRIF
jgi:hypothetical protein